MCNNIGKEKIFFVSSIIGNSYFDKFFNIFTKDLTNHHSLILCYENINESNINDIKNKSILCSEIPEKVFENIFDPEGLKYKSLVFYKKIYSIYHSLKIINNLGYNDNFICFWIDADSYVKFDKLAEHIEKLPNKDIYYTFGRIGRSVLSSGFFGFNFSEKNNGKNAFFELYDRINGNPKYYNHNKWVKIFNKYGDQIFLHDIIKNRRYDTLELPYKQFNNWYPEEWDKSTFIFHLAKDARKMLSNNDDEKFLENIKRLEKF